MADYGGHSIPRVAITDSPPRTSPGEKTFSRRAPKQSRLPHSPLRIHLPNGRALTDFAHEYKRHGTTTLFAALNASGLVHAGHYRRRRRREFLDFMNELISKYPGKELHVVLDNLNTHKPKEDRWLKAHPNVHLHFIPTHSSWLNQVECWFSILSRSTLQGGNFTSVRMLIEAIEAFIASWNQNAAPFEWTKAEVHQQQMNTLLL